MYRSLKTFYVFRVDWKAIYGHMFNYLSYWKGKKVTCYAADPLVLSDTPTSSELQEWPSRECSLM
jgi:hypothetical protein